MKKATLILDDNTRFNGYSFGAEHPAGGEVVFNTAMTGCLPTIPMMRSTAFGTNYNVIILKKVALTDLTLLIF